MTETPTPAPRRRRFLVTLMILAVLMITTLTATAAYAQDQIPPLEPGDTESGSDEPEGEYGPTGMCDVSEESFNSQLYSFSGGAKGTNGGKAPMNSPENWMTCPPDAYYLTYVDTRSVFGKISDLADKPTIFVVSGMGKTSFNAAASSVFVLHAKLIALSIGVLNFAFDMDLVNLLKEPVKTINKVLGDKVYKVLLPAVWGLAIGYGAYLSIMRDRATDGITAIIKSAVIGTIGIMIIANPLKMVTIYDDYIDGASSLVFQMAADVAVNGKKADGKPDCAVGTPGCRPGDGNHDYFGDLSKTIWTVYVDRPYARLQISQSDAKVANAEYKNLLDIKYQDGREKFLCDLAGSECGQVVGGGPEEEPESTEPEATQPEVTPPAKDGAPPAKDGAKPPARPKTPGGA